MGDHNISHGSQVMCACWVLGSLKTLHHFPANLFLGLSVKQFLKLVTFDEVMTKTCCLTFLDQRVQCDMTDLSLNAKDGDREAYCCSHCHSNKYDDRVVETAHVIEQSFNQSINQSINQSVNR